MQKYTYPVRKNESKHGEMVPVRQNMILSFLQPMRRVDVINGRSVRIVSSHNNSIIDWATFYVPLDTNISQK